MNKIDFTLFNPAAHKDAIIISLMEHIASGAVSNWTVRDDRQSYGRFDTYEEANALFESLSPDYHPALELWTRVGTAVRFRYMEAS